MKQYTDNELFNDMANMVDAMKVKEDDMLTCRYPECDGVRDNMYDDFCYLHEKAISDAQDEYDAERDFDRTALDYADSWVPDDIG